MKYTMIILTAALFSSCMTTTVKDMLTLQEVAPLPREVAVVKVWEYEPVYNVLKIVEVTERNGVQSQFMVRYGADRTGIAVGTKGDIGADPTFEKIIGTYRITNIYRDFFQAEIETLDYKIGANGYIRIKIGEKVKDSK